MNDLLSRWVHQVELEAHSGHPEFTRGYKRTIVSPVRFSVSISAHHSGVFLEDRVGDDRLLAAGPRYGIECDRTIAVTSRPRWGTLHSFKKLVGHPQERKRLPRTDLDRVTTCA